MLNTFFRAKICDPVHGFIRLSEIETKVVDSRPFQRLRYIQQMGVAYLVYPGATHTRFEHSLGVMELASRVYDTLMHPMHLFSSLKKALPSDAEEIGYWRQILRLAALCHDLGHLPFSHTAEKSLLPSGGHERKTVELVQSPDMRALWIDLGKQAEEDILKLAVSEAELQALDLNLTLNPWEKMLSQVITDDNFGADRIDYLLRDARSTGVGYGHFDYQQLIDTLRILPGVKGSVQLSIGVAESGIQSVESLWIARYLMYARVYQHPKVRLLSHHMQRFMVDLYKERGFPSTLEGYLKEIDPTIINALYQKAEDGHSDARILLKLEEAFKEVILENDQEEIIRKELQALRSVLDHHFIIDDLSPKNPGRSLEQLRYFSVLKEDGQLISSVESSQFLREIPLGGKSMRVYVARDQKALFQQWLSSKQAIEPAST